MMFVKINNKIFLGILFIGFCVFLSTFLFLGEGVFALSANYNKVNNDQLSILEWNEIKNDFLAKSGEVDGVMSGELNVNNNRITNLGALSDSGDLVSRAYIDRVVISAGGGTTFTNWGRSDCPSGTTQLYHGFGFGSTYNDRGGIGGNLCIQSNGNGPDFPTSAISGNIHPLVTAPHIFYLPTEISPINTFIRCSVCYQSNSSCYVKIGDNVCDGAFNNLAYDGYMLGALSGNIYLHYSSKERICVNDNFDNTPVADTFPVNSRAYMYASRVEDNFDLTDFSERKYIRCAVCCN